MEKCLFEMNLIHEACMLVQHNTWFGGASLNLGLYQAPGVVVAAQAAVNLYMTVEITGRLHSVHFKYIRSSITQNRPYKIE